MLPRRLLRVEDDRGEACGRQMCSLVVLERDQRRDHDRRPVTQEACELVDRRFATARRQHREHVATLDSSTRGFQLARTQPLEAEPRPRELLDRPLAHAKTLPRGAGKAAATSIVEATL